jgi:iron complex transport system ATP-binding protein
MRIEAREIAAGYGPHNVLQGVSLHLAPGEFLGLIGPNGAGKSTLLRVLSRALTARQGAVRLDGDLVERLTAREVARRLAFVPQTEPTLFEFTVREVVLMGRHPHRRGLAGETQEDFAAAMRAMSATDTLQLADRPVTALSGGEHRRVLIARALAQNAPTLLLDELTAHLDMTHQAEVLSLVRRLADRDGVSVLAALHDLNLAAEFCDRLVLLANGRVAAEGLPDAVLTPETLTRAYGAPVRVGRSPASGKPFVLPVSPAPAADSQQTLRVHLFCGGGTGLAVMSALQRRGYVVTAGVLNRLDTDEEAAAALGVERVTEAPFSPIGPEARAACADLIKRADAVVVTGVPIGNGNLANLQMASEAQAGGKPVYLLGETPFAARDFTGGAAQELFDALLQAGAQAVAVTQGLEALLEEARRRICATEDTARQSRNQKALNHRDTETQRLHRDL